MVYLIPLIAEYVKLTKLAEKDELTLRTAIF
jgi:hypothetical protein